jgi:hypothetical protein
MHSGCTAGHHKGPKSTRVGHVFCDKHVATLIHMHPLLPACLHACLTLPCHDNTQLCIPLAQSPSARRDPYPHMHTEHKHLHRAPRIKNELPEHRRAGLPAPALVPQSCCCHDLLPALYRLKEIQAGRQAGSKQLQQRQEASSSGSQQAVMANKLATCFVTEHSAVGDVLLSYASYATPCSCWDSSISHAAMLQHQPEGQAAHKQL